MKKQLNLLNQVQELILTRDEHHQTGDGSHMDKLNDSIDALTADFDPKVKVFFQRLYKKDHIFMSPMVKGTCAICSMKLPVSQVQQVQLEKTLQTCPSCGRILFNEDEDAPRFIGARLSRAEEIRKSGIGRFSAETLMIPDLKATSAAEAIAELAQAMEANKFISNSEQLVAAALERESILSTAMDNGIAFPHVRGVEGGGLTLAMGVSKKGFDYNGSKVNVVFFTTIPTAVSAFYLRLMATLAQAFEAKDSVAAVVAAETPADLWKALGKATRKTIR